MDAGIYIQMQFKAAHDMLDLALIDLTDEQLNAEPPGASNPIRASLIHLLNTEDRVINELFQGKKSVWESGGWAPKIGLTDMIRRGGWDEAKHTPVSLPPIAEYRQAVYETTDIYLKQITDEELHRIVRFLGAERPIYEVLATIASHAVFHAGNISEIKGFLGAKGLPF